MAERTAVYRLYDASGKLLYVGISNDFGRRWKQHAGTQPWWPEVHQQTVTWYPTRETAKMIEIQAIAGEHPAYNVCHAPNGANPHLIPDPAHRFGRPPVDGSGPEFAEAVRKRYEPGPAPAYVPDLAERYGNVCDLIVQLLWPEQYRTGPGDPITRHTSTPARQITQLIFEAAGIWPSEIEAAMQDAAPGTCEICQEEKLLGRYQRPPHGRLCANCLSGLEAFGHDPEALLQAAVKILKES